MSDNQADPQLLLESLALLFLACGKLTDGDLNQAEGRRIVELVRGHVADLSPALADGTIADVADAFGRLEGPEAKLREVALAAERLAENLDVPSMERVVRELIDLTGADGSVDQSERDFVEAVARTFGVDLEVVR